MVANHKPTRRLGDVPVGARIRLYAKYRDGSPRPRYRFGRVYLQQGTMEVLRHEGVMTDRGMVATVTWLDAGKTAVPVSSDWRIA